MDFNFYAQYGDISTTTPWKRPTLISVTDWWKEFMFETELENYNCYLVGSFMEKTLGVYGGYPNDFDVVLTGDISNHRKLKELMDSAVRIGFENKLLVDIVWASDIVMMMDKFRPYSIVRNTKTFIKYMGGESYQKNFTADEEYSLYNGLTQFVWYEPSPSFKKVQERKDNGLYVGVVQDAKYFFE